MTRRKVEFNGGRGCVLMPRLFSLTKRRTVGSLHSSETTDMP
jgi:hypothetical protein